MSAAEAGNLPNVRLGEPTIEEKEADARRRIAYIIVVAYVVVLTVSVVPIVVYLIATKGLRPTDVGNLMTTVAATVSSVSGVFGFVLSYYFKAIEGSDTKRATRKATTTRQGKGPKP
jgi:hypothetical protein